MALCVESELPYLAARVAYFLATDTGLGYAADAEGPFTDPDSLHKVMGSAFDLDAAAERAARSRWRG